MKTKQNFSGLKSVLIGVGTYMVFVFILMIMEATLIYNGATDEKSISLIANVIHMISAAIGCIVGKRIIKEKMMLTAVYIGVGDMLLVMIVKLLFSTTAFSGIFIRIIMIAIGTSIGCVLFSGRRKKTNMKRQKFRIR